MACPRVVSLAVELPPAAAGAEQVRRVVAEVLARPEYSELPPSVAARVREWLAEQLGRLLEAVLGTGQASLVGSVLLAVAVVVAVVVAVRFAGGLRGDPEAAVVTAEGLGRDPADWAADADEHRRAGRHRDALRCRYRALIAVLAAAGVVEETPGRTAGEYLAEIRRRRPEVAGHAAAVTAAFDAVWYGHAPVDAAELDQVAGRVEAVRAAVVARRPAATAGDPR